jgi:cyclic beta-1,2-glucan synthetase
VTSAVETQTSADPNSLRSRLASAELFTQEQLEAYATRLAREHHVATDPRDARPFVSRTEEIGRELDDIYKLLSAAGRAAQPVPSEDWLRDNHFVVQDQVRAIRRDLPRKFYLELPKLEDGAYARYPRVFALASELVIHTAGRFDLQALVGFAAAYQRVAPLSIGEVWAFSIMLRAALLEELVSLARDVVTASRAREEARRWWVRLGGSRPEEAANTLAESLGAAVRPTGRLSDAFVVELLQWLRDQPVAAAPAWQVLERELEAQGNSAEEMLRREHAREASTQLAIGNIITSMRLVGAVDWPVFFDRVSTVEQMLRQDPARAYAAMDFPTRDRYRHSVEELAHGSGRSEADVARRAVELARAAQQTAGSSDRQHHVGYFLISRGRFKLEVDVGYPPKIREQLGRFVFKHPALGYLGMIAVSSAIALVSFLLYAARHGGTSGDLWLVALVVLLPAADVAISLLNLLVTTQVPPRQLPRFDLRGGIPESDRTFVVVPVIIDTEEHVAELLGDLEVRFFANRDPHLHFALLTDLPDADQPSAPGDAALIEQTHRGIAELNERHGGDRFFLFHRERRWNPQERRWMGWERKRGKLHEFNRLLRGATDTSFVVTAGRLELLASTRYVITLDSDTQLPLDTARVLVGTLSHPLNRARFDPRLKRVTEGYGILQPRVSVNIVSANRTTFARVFSGHVGLDPYTTAVSDVYQDLFHEGSYVGKGIYDVDAFEAALDGRVPENTLLSHDLFEGSFARAALCTDIHLVDDYPSHYLAAAGRQHRWVRGDWQIARWLWRTVPSASGRSMPNTLPVIARWKILDNLRRSLNPLALVALFACGWTILPGSPWLWTSLALLVIAFPAYTQFFRSLSSRHAGVPLGEHLSAERENITNALRQAGFTLVFVAHQSAVMTDAIVRVGVRLLVTRRHLLEWVTADRAAVPHTAAGVWRRMWPAPATALALLALVGAVRPDRLMLAAPILILWMLSPLAAHRLGRPLVHRHEVLTANERATLRRTARKTWRFFEELIGPADNWLIPDNYQDNRVDVVAHRTSPTNIGLQLLSVLSAYDFGYLSVSGVIDHLEPTFDTLLRMQRYRGHFFNWYDTKTLVPLSPAYISTVDSGNLAGYLLTLRSGLIELIEDRPIIDASALEGVEDALNLFDETVPRGLHDTVGSRWSAGLEALRAALATRPATVDAWRVLLNDLRNHLESVSVLLHELEEGADANRAGSPLPSAVEAEYWLERAAVLVAGREAELERLTGWMHADDSELARWRDAPVPTLQQLADWCAEATTAFDGRRHADAQRSAVAAARGRAEDAIDRSDRLAALADDLLEEIEFDFLFSPDRQLFSIGYSVTDGRLDNSHYDLLASEARLASFIAIATGKVSQEHWFKLGRALTPAGGRRALLSWSGSMFEYLMPLLVMRTHRGTLLDETYDAVLIRQIDYGAKRSVPWGISESAYNVTDLDGNYQYRAFGVPGLGLKRGLADDLVVAPYATVLAAPLSPRAVVRNLQRLQAEALSGRFGYYEAIDYTAERLPQDSKGGAVLVTYMAHHQGMSLIALGNAMHDSPMQRRFHADPRVQSAELLLYERIPQLVPLKNPPTEMAEHMPSSRTPVAPHVRRYVTPHTLSPRTHLLSNGSYCVMVTNAGGGYSRRQHLAMTRWREDITTDDWGSFCYVRDLETGRLWSTAHQPTAADADEYEVTFAQDRAVFRRRDDDIETRTEIVVSPEDDVEIRRVSLTNHGNRARSLDVTSYAEVVIAPHDADLAHPAFSNLFIETRAVTERDALICARRPRAGDERPYLVHVMSGRGRAGPGTQFETDRARFIGRGRTLARPLALTPGANLSNTTGPVLDPIVSLRQSIRLPPGGTARLAFTTGFAASESEARGLIEKYHDRRAVARALALAGTHNQIELRHLGLTADDAIRFQRLGGRLIYGDPRLRSVEALQVNRRGQSELWKYGISGDLPILLVRVSDDGELPLIRELLKAHEYLRRKGLLFDLVVLNEHGAGYRQDLQDAVQSMVESSPERPWLDQKGGVFLRRADIIEPEDQLLLRATARAVMEGTTGGLHQQLTRPPTQIEPPPAAPRHAPPRSPAAGAPMPDGSALEYFNGIGGFAAGGREYVIHVDCAANLLPPAPWSNVIAHATFGFTTTELTPGCTWAGNSHDNRLTPWRNDPVRDDAGEAVFVRDDDTLAYWSATPLPAGRGPFTVRHAHGSTTFEHTRDQIISTLQLSLPPDDSVKLFHLRLRNSSKSRRRLSVTLYVEWVLGEQRDRTRPHVVTSREAATGALMATNAFREVFADRVAFVDLAVPGADGAATRRITGDRGEFIGRNGSLAQPAALSRDLLSDRVGAALDPCGAVQVRITLGPGEERLIIGQLGEAPDAEAVRQLVQRYRAPGSATAIERTRVFWDDLLTSIQVKTPERSMDLLLNGWLLYQALACRIWGRTAFYQSSGAFGFRDQLQDVLAFTFTRPQMVRDQLLRAASRQFLEGDVQHWWHEPGGQGVRTRFSDDRLWLVYASLKYVAATGDAGVWDESVPFLEGRVLNPDEHEAYERPAVSSENGTLYEHCVRAVTISMPTGAHGLPLMGIGDWNDGMSLVGAGGRGESVWLGWFLVSLLEPFAQVAETRGEADRAGIYRGHATALTRALEDAWDGEWYRRAYFDDGTPLGSRTNEECRIDAIAQSWATISGAGDPARAQQALESVQQHLVREKDGLVLLLAPPFDKMKPSPGYIQGYVPGVRENGGQYTHAALWTVMATAMHGNGDRAEALFRLINPVNHARSREDVQKYRVEPYVVAADVYSQPMYPGRGGWTWYTGSAGWMYRVGIESILGLHLEGNALRVDPCIPRSWAQFEATIRQGSSVLHLIVENPDRVSRGVQRISLDGVDQVAPVIPLDDRKGTREARVILGRRE